MVRSAVYRLARVPLTFQSPVLPSIYRPVSFHAIRHNSTAPPTPPIIDKGLRMMLAKPFVPPPIPFRAAQVVDPVTNSLLPVQPIREILASFDHTTHVALCVSENPPVIRIRNIEEFRTEAYYAAAQKRDQIKVQTSEKEVQVPWTTADGDLQRKVESAKEFLRKGDKLSITFAPRVGGGGAKAMVPQARKDQIMARFERELADLASKSRDDEVLKRSTTMFWRPNADLVEAAKKVTRGNVMDKKMERMARKAERAAKAAEKTEKAAEKAKNVPKLDFLVQQEEAERQERENLLIAKIQADKERAEMERREFEERRQLRRGQNVWQGGAARPPPRTFGARR